MWKNTIKKADDEITDEETRKFKVINPLLEKIKKYMIDHDLNEGAAKEAFEALEFEIMTQIGYTGQYENDDATPMEDAMYREREGRGF